MRRRASDFALNDGYNRVLTREHATKEKAFEDACSLRRTCFDLSIEGPDGRNNEADIVEWCKKNGK
jgi:hypothetical protein